MDTSTPSTPSAPDHGPDDPALVRLLRALAAPLRDRPDADVRRRHVSAASAVARGEAVAPAPRSARAGRWSVLPRPTALRRPVLAGGLALSLVAGLVAAAVVVPDGLFTRGGDGFEIAMEQGFTPSPVPFERTEDHVILTVDADRAERVSAELAVLLDADPTVLSVRTDRTAFTVPASVAAALEASAAPELAEVEVVADTPVRSTSTVPVTQSPVPSWGLDRIDAEDEPLDGRYRYVSTGAGVTVYVIDTGVRSDHADLAGRVLPGWSAIEDGRGTEDCNGHGTHVAGTVAGSAFGVAKSARIVPVRVLDCSGAGFASSVVAGISWVIANHPGGPGVINLSLGGPANSAIDRAVADAAARGLTVVAAAGNEGGDACSVSPARSAAAVTIGATTSRDARASYSNFGPCVDMFAPGSGITSAWHTGSGASATLSGTSMAAPHAAGIAARLLQNDPGASPSRISSLLTGSATSGAVSGSDGSANLLLNLVDFDEDEIDCAALLDELEPGERIPDECLEEICELLDEQGAELPEQCLDDEEREDDEDERDGEGRPDSPPGLGGLLPPGFGGPIPGLERAPGLDGRVPPGLNGGTPPGLADREGGLPPGLAEREEGVPPGLAEREDRVPPGLTDRAPGRPAPEPAPEPEPAPAPAPQPAPAPEEPSTEQVQPRPDGRPSLGERPAGPPAPPAPSQATPRPPQSSSAPPAPPARGNQAGQSNRP